MGVKRRRPGPLAGLFLNNKLAAVMLLAILLRVIMANMPLTGIHSWKEAEFAGMAKLFLEQGDVFTPRYYHLGPHNQIFPIPAYLIMLSWSIFGGYDWATHLPFILFGVASVLMLYKTCRIIYSEEVSLAASFFLAISPMHAYYSKNAQAESILVFFIVTAAYFFLRWAKTGKPGDYYLSAISLSVATLNKYTALFILPAFIAYVLFSRARFPSPGMAAASIGIIALPSLLWITHVSQFEEVYGFQGFSIFLGFPPVGTFIYKVLLGVAWGAGATLLFTVFILPKFKKEYLFPCLWLLAGALYVLVLRNMILANDYYLLPLVPAFCMTSALGFDLFLRKTRNKAVPKAALVAAALASVLFIGVLYSIQHPIFKEAGEYVKEHTSKSEWFLFTESPVMCYYAERNCRGGQPADVFIKFDSRYNMTYLALTSTVKAAYFTPEYEKYLSQKYVLEKTIYGRSNVLANYGIGGRREYVEIYRRKA